MKAGRITVLWLAVLCLAGGCRKKPPDPADLLHRAAGSGDSRQTVLAISRGADVNAKGARGLTPLHIAATNGLIGVAKLLLAHGADVNAIGFEGTALHCAVRHEHTAMIKCLIAAGADINAQSLGEGLTPLGLALVHCRAGRIKTIQALLAAGADPDVADSSGAGVLHGVAGSEDVDLAKLLLA